MRKLVCGLEFEFYVVAIRITFYEFIGPKKLTYVDWLGEINYFFNLTIFFILFYFIFFLISFGDFLGQPFKDLMTHSNVVNCTE